MALGKLDQIKYATKKSLSLAFHAKENAVCINRTSNFKHELAKFLLCWEAMQQNHDIITEARFNNGKRADVLVLQLAEAWEVVHSESDKSIEQKKEEYPVKLLKFDAQKIIDHWKKHM
jgi:hypothetical protein